MCAKTLDLLFLGHLGHIRDDKVLYSYPRGLEQKEHLFGTRTYAPVQALGNKSNSLDLPLVYRYWDCDFNRCLIKCNLCKSEMFSVRIKEFVLKNHSN